MKKFLALLLAFIFIILPLGAIQTPKGFAGKLWNSTFALYGTKNGVTHFICTAFPIQKTASGYRLLSAGHCVQETPADLQFSVAEEIGGARTPVTMDKAYLGGNIDFSLFTLKTTKTYTVLVEGDEKDLHVGDKTINPNFAIGIGKQLSLGVVSSQSMVKSEDCTDDDCIGSFMVQEHAGPGASGSAVLSAKTHKVVGILVYQFHTGSVGFAIEPISRYAKFIMGPNQPHPAEEAAVDADEPPSILIPADVFAAQFGSAHPFTLTAHGPNPTFVQGGYKFRIDTDGLELSDEYYYDVPVFITTSAYGYILESTKDGVSVDLTVLGKE